MAFTYDVWGLFAVIVGLVIFGVGVVPVAILAAVLNGQWEMLGILALLIVMTFASRTLGFWLAEKAQERKYRLDAKKYQTDQVYPARRQQSVKLGSRDDPPTDQFS